MSAYMDREEAWAVYNETGWDPFRYFEEVETEDYKNRVKEIERFAECKNMGVYLALKGIRC